LRPTKRSYVNRWRLGILSGLGSLVVVAVLVASQALSVAPGASASAVPSFSIARLAGANRFATAAAIAQATFPSGASTVVLSTGTSFPDALAGNFLAGNLGAPILLTSPTGTTPTPTLAELAALHASRIVVLGGTAAVSAAQVSSLGHLGYQVTRVAGSNRYQTMSMVAEYSGTKVGRDSAGVPTAILATGISFPDALSAGPLSFSAKLPVILTNGAAPTLTPIALQTITALHIGHILSLGGSAAMNPAIDTELTNMGIDVTPLSGPTRSATSMAVADQEVSDWGFSTTAFDLARGDDFADALTAGPAAGVQDEPLLITASPSSPGSVYTYAADNAATLTTSDALGGSGAITDGLLSGLVQVILSVVAPPTTTPPTTTPPTTLAPINPTINYPPPPQPAGSPYPNGGLGFDISWPQCPTMALPNGINQFDVIGVNDGHAYSINPCLQAQAAWAGGSPSLVMNLNVPVPGWDTNQANHLITGPDASCAATKNLACEYYDYGYNAAINSMANAALDNVSANVTWWLDIEAPGSQLWSNSTTDNAQVIAGAIASLNAAGHYVGIYSTAYQWGLIAGSYAPGAALWVATGGAPSNLADWCSSAYAFGGGTTWLVQFGRGSFDGDYSC
jgi:putative cell wall-binding protein